MDFLFNAVLDLDLDSGRVRLRNVPDWLADIMSLAMGSLGRNKFGVDEAISLLESVELLDDVDDTVCPICYESYADPKHYDLQGLRNGTPVQDEHPPTSRDLERLIELDDDVHDAFRHLECERWRSKLRFNDPLMYFPVDELGFNYLRVPQRMLLDSREVDDLDLFPNYDTGFGSSGASQVTNPDLHIPMRIAQCRHVFGRLCLVEWFKNNLSCPLCRQQMAAEETNSQGVASQRRRRLERDGRFAFSDRARETEDLMVVTDVFAPPRRAPSTTVTPLTDLYVRQHWATPPDAPQAPPLAPDPDLVMPQRFRGSESISFFAID